MPSLHITSHSAHTTHRHRIKPQLLYTVTLHQYFHYRSHHTQPSSHFTTSITPLSIPSLTTPHPQPASTLTSVLEPLKFISLVSLQFTHQLALYEPLHPLPHSLAPSLSHSAGPSFTPLPQLLFWNIAIIIITHGLTLIIQPAFSPLSSLLHPTTTFTLLQSSTRPPCFTSHSPHSYLVSPQSCLSGHPLPLPSL